MKNKNIQAELEKKLSEIMDLGIHPKLLLHSCCAPCSSHVITYLAPFFEICVLYYNPNIFPESEYLKRKAEQQRFIKMLPFNVDFTDSDYETDVFYDAIKGFEIAPEGKERCEKCIELRLKKTMSVAEKNGYDFFTTTLSVSPHKNAAFINETLEKISGSAKVSPLIADFKKKDGYKRSIVLSGEYNLYRQNYCGCEFSLNI